MNCTVSLRPVSDLGAGNALRKDKIKAIFKIKKREGDHDDEVFHFKSPHVDEALLGAAFSYDPRRNNHPMRYWAIAGWGPVPAVLRAPEGIYRELELVNPSDLDQDIQWDIPTWFETQHDQNIIFVKEFHRDVSYMHRDIKVGEVKWVAVINVRDDTTVENLRIPPNGSEEIVWSSRDLQTFVPPVDRATGREYFEMTRGELLVRDFTTRYDNERVTLQMVVYVGNAAVGKWFWEFYHRHDDDGSELSQLVVWHESVDDFEEYRTPLQGADERDIIRMCDNDIRDGVYVHDGFRTSYHFEENFKERKAALAVVDIFLWAADAEPQIRHAMAQFMTKDPNSLWWKRGGLPDGFLKSTFENQAWRTGTGMVIGDLKCEKLCLATEMRRMFDRTGRLSARTILGGCAVDIPKREYLMSIQFKPSQATGKIVAMRAVFEDFQD